MKRFNMIVTSASLHPTPFPSMLRVNYEYQIVPCEDGAFVDAEVAAEMLEALEMVRELDMASCLLSLSGPARAKIGAAIAKAKGE